MNDKISCDICMDLMPLVKENVASDDSKKTVNNHISECNSCKKIYLSFDNFETKIDDKKVFNSIKKGIYNTFIIFIILGLLIGITLTNSKYLFYNILLMPIIGALAYILFNKKSYIVILFLFIGTILANFTFIDPLSGIIPAIEWAFVYVFLASVGILIAFLLKFAFKKEKKEF